MVSPTPRLGDMLTWMVTPKVISSSAMARTSASRGTLAKIRGSAVRSDAAINFKAAFLAPLMGISPFRGKPPRIRIRSIKTLVAGGPAQGKPGKKQGYSLVLEGSFEGC